MILLRNVLLPSEFYIIFAVESNKMTNQKRQNEVIEEVETREPNERVSISV